MYKVLMKNSFCRKVLKVLLAYLNYFVQNYVLNTLCLQRPARTPLAPFWSLGLFSWRQKIFKICSRSKSEAEELFVKKKFSFNIISNWKFGAKILDFFLLLWSNFFVQILLRWHRHRRIKAKEVRNLKLWSFLFGWVTIWKGCRLGQHLCHTPEVFLLGRAIIEFLIRAKRAISLDSLKKTDPLGVPKPEC